MAAEQMKNEPRIDPKEILEGIVEWIEIESPSHDAKAVNLMVDKVEGQFRDLGLALDEIGFVAHRVPAGILAFIDVARRDQLLPQGLAGRVMARLGGADEVIGAVVHHPDQVAERLAHLVGEGLWRQAGGGGRRLDLLAVLVGAGQKMHVVAVEALEACQHIAGERRVGMPDMGHVVDVVDRRGDVIGAFARHDD